MAKIAEVWKGVPGYELFYQVSNLGRIKSLDRPRDPSCRRGFSGAVKGRILSPVLGNTGYSQVQLQHKTTRVHRIVAKAFIPNPENKPQVNHKNGIKTDNRAENLEWATRCENMRHAHKNGLMRIHRGMKSNLAKLTDSCVRKIREKHSVGSHSIAQLSSYYNTSQSNISIILRRLSWKHI